MVTMQTYAAAARLLLEKAPMKGNKYVREIPAQEMGIPFQPGEPRSVLWCDGCRCFIFAPDTEANHRHGKN